MHHRNSWHLWYFRWFPLPISCLKIYYFVGQYLSSIYFVRAILILGINIQDRPFECRWVLSNQLKVWIEHKGWLFCKKNETLLASLLCSWGISFSPHLDSALFGAQASLPLQWNYSISSPSSHAFEHGPITVIDSSGSPVCWL